MIVSYAKYDKDNAITAVIDGAEYSGIQEGMWGWNDVQEWVVTGNTIHPYVSGPIPGLTKIYKSDIWRKATDAEAVTIKAGLLQQPVRLQELWASVSYISTTDELYTALRAGFVAAFGEARTNELLEATE